MIGLLCFALAVLAAPFKSKLRLEAENAVLRHQLIVLRRTLNEALQSFSKALPKFPPSASVPQKNTGSPLNAQQTSGRNSVTTTSAPDPSTHALTSAGIPGAVTLPNGKEEAVRMVLEEAELVAKNATTTWLPQPIQSWLSCLGCSVKKENGEPMSPLPVPVLSEAERGQLTQALWMLTQATKPASLKPEDLVEAVRIAMLELPFRMRSSEGHLALTLKVWADAVRDYPLWAVQKAAKWWSRGARDRDELRHFLADVRLAVGSNVLERKRLLEGVSIAR
jgi:hypothetical protein